MHREEGARAAEVFVKPMDSSSMMRPEETEREGNGEGRVEGGEMMWDD